MMIRRCDGVGAGSAWEFSYGNGVHGLPLLTIVAEELHGIPLLNSTNSQFLQLNNRNKSMTVAKAIQFV